MGVHRLHAAAEVPVKLLTVPDETADSQSDPKWAANVATRTRRKTPTMTALSQDGEAREPRFGKGGAARVARVSGDGSGWRFRRIRCQGSEKDLRPARSEAKRDALFGRDAFNRSWDESLDCPQGKRARRNRRSRWSRTRKRRAGTPGGGPGQRPPPARHPSPADGDAQEIEQPTPAAAGSGTALRGADFPPKHSHQPADTVLREPRISRATGHWCESLPWGPVCLRCVDTQISMAIHRVARAARRAGGDTLSTRPRCTRAHRCSPPALLRARLELCRRREAREKDSRIFVARQRPVLRTHSPLRTRVCGALCAFRFFSPPLVCHVTPDVDKIPYRRWTV